jgi:hypothetical protein
LSEERELSLPDNILSSPSNPLHQLAARTDMVLRRFW